MPSIDLSVSMLSKSLEQQSLIAKMVTNTVDAMNNKPSNNIFAQNAEPQVQSPPQEGLGSIVDKVI